jgi:hypothetical protein
MTPWVQPSVSFLTSLNDPIFPYTARSFALRIGFTVIWKATGGIEMERQK